MRDANPKKKRTGKATISQGLLVVSPEGEIRFAEPQAIRILRRFFGRRSPARFLPLKIRRWLTPGDGHRASRLFILVRGDARLFVTLQRPCSANLISLLVEGLRGAPGERARRHGSLTRREIEALYWVGEGKSNPEIAQILTIAPATVGKHLEHAYFKLEVYNRTDAARFAPSEEPGYSHAAGQ